MNVLAVFAGGAMVLLAAIAGVGIYFYNQAVKEVNKTVVAITEQFQVERYKMREHELTMLRSVLERVQQPLPPLQYAEQEKPEEDVPKYDIPLATEDDSILQSLIGIAHKETGTDG